uniref:PRC-barrel domain-containing protein n=1 Tax=Opuntia streptacantha TaxID=393608 RepID=A0A7C9AWK9_OPUST
MCDCVQSSLIVPNGGFKFGKFGKVGCNSRLAFLPFSGKAIGSTDCAAIAKGVVIDIERVKNLKVSGKREKPLMDVKVCSSLGVFDSNGFDLRSKLGLKEGEDEKFEMGLRNEKDKLRDFIRENEADELGMKSLKREKQQNPINEGLREDKVGLKSKDLIGVGSKKSEELKEEVQLQPKGKQLMKRSSLLAKQVIGIQSALSFGFVSQLWVDTAAWVVLEVEVRPNLLFSESGKFLLEDIKQIGDVVLVPDERIMLNEFRTVGLETLVGYSVLTPGQGHLGKVRGYTFDINSGAVESLELDAFGYSIIPSSLVSTYALSTKDVLDVVSDTVIVHEAAASRIQRLTKGFLGTKSMGISSSNLKYSVPEEESSGRPIKGRKPKRKSNKRKSYGGISDFEDDLELPMDYM